MMRKWLHNFSCKKDQCLASPDTGLFVIMVTLFTYIYMRTLTSNIKTVLLILAMALLMSTAFSQTVSANVVMTLAERPQSIESLQSLQAKIAYLTSWIEALREGDLSPAPTLVSALKGDVVFIDGTLARDPGQIPVEVCGSVVKGHIDWGDGFSEPLRGLGCSGDSYTFTRFHRYSDSDSYQVKVTDGQGREGVRVVAVISTGVEEYGTMTLSQDENIVSVEGELILDESLPKTCDLTTMGIVSWGDGWIEKISTDCSDTKYVETHTYQEPGIYKLMVRDRDGDINQEIITVD